MKRFLVLLLALMLGLPGAAQAADNRGLVRLKDLGHLGGWRDNMLVGYGIVTGLAGTGDSPRNRATRQSIANVLVQFGINLPSDLVTSRNVAAVTVMATLPPFGRSGSRIDVVVSSLGDARSLVGGALLLTPLRGPDGRTYALAQGPLSVGGYRYDLFGNLVQKNHPTVGRIPSGAVIEAEVPAPEGGADGIATFVLAQPDYTTASRVADAVNAALGAGTARPTDAGSIEIRLPKGDLRTSTVAFLTRVENLEVEPGLAARIVVNERTGMVVSGGDVRISPVTISHGELRVSITTDYGVSQPFAPLVGFPAPGGRTVVVPRTRIDVTEPETHSVSLAAKSSSVADLVQALGRIRTSPRDMISILQGMRAAGALHADLIIQ